MPNLCVLSSPKQLIKISFSSSLRLWRWFLAYLKRVIAHPSFRNVTFKDAEKLLESMDQGDAIVRPSSKVGSFSRRFICGNVLIIPYFTFRLVMIVHSIVCAIYAGCYYFVLFQFSYAMIFVHYWENLLTVFFIPLLDPLIFLDHPSLWGFI